MRRAERLRTRYDFAAVYRRGRPYRSDLLTLRVLRTTRPLSRYGFAVGRAVGNAVVRNRVKRRLREAVGSLPVTPGWDFVLNVRPGAEQADYQRLRSSVAELMDRAGVVDRDKEASAQ